jgi:hypothetical protein
MNIFSKWLKQKKGNLLILEPEPKFPVENTNFVGTLNCNIICANGGIILQFRQYDDIKDRHLESLHIIPDTEQDQFNAIGRIISMEMLKRKC